MNNLKRFGSTMMVLALVAAVGGGCTRTARRNRVLARADRYYADEQYGPAEDAYKQAMRLVLPSSPVAIRQLGLIFSEEGRPVTALVYLQHAAKDEPDNAKVQLALALTYATLGAPKQAKDAATAVLKLQPGDETALMLICDVVQNPTELAQTRQSIEDLRKQDKDRASYHLALGTLDAKEKKIDDADAELKKALEMNPTSSLTYMSMGNVCMLRHDLKGAEADFKKAADLAPVRGPARIQYAKFQIRNGETNEAKANLIDLAQKAPDYLPPLLNLMELSYNERKYDDADMYASQVLAHEPGNYEALMQKGAVSLAKGDGKQAVADFERMSSITAKNPRPDVQYQLALAELLDGSRPKAFSALNKALELDPNYIPAKLLLADLDIREGSSVAAVSLLQQMEARQQPPEVLVQVKLILAKAYLAQNDPGDAVTEFEGVEKLEPKDAEVPYLKGKALVQGKQPGQARAAFEKSLQLNPDFINPLEELVDLDLTEGLFPAAEERAKQEIERAPKSAMPLLLAAKIAMVENKNQQAEEFLQKAVELEPNLPSSYLLLARLYIKSNQEQAALDKLTALVARTNNASAQLQIGMIYEQKKEYDKAAASYGKALEVDPRFSPALNNLACVDSEHLNQLDRAYQLAETNREIAPFDPYVADTLGWIVYQKADYPRALALLTESVEKQQNDPDVHYHVGMAHYMMGEEDPARQELQFAVSKGDFEGRDDAVESLNILAIDPAKATPAERSELEKRVAANSSDTIALMRLAAIEERDGDAAKAATHYEAALKQNPQNIRAMARLAQLDCAHPETAAKGLELAKQANKLAPDDPNVSALLGRLEFQAGDFKFALGLLQDAAGKLPNQPDLQHDLAWCYFSAGQIPDAGASMQRALQAGTPFSKQDDARQFVEMLNISANPAQPQAAAQVQKALQADPNYAPALLASATLLERQGNSKDAEALYEKILAAYPLFAPASRELAILYARDGDDVRAHANAEKALAVYLDDANLIKAAGIVDYRQKDYQRSIQLLRRIVDVSANDAEVFYYLGKDYAQADQKGSAKTYLQRAINLKLPDTLAADARQTLSGLK